MWKRCRRRRRKKKEVLEEVERERTTWKRHTKDRREARR